MARARVKVLDTDEIGCTPKKKPLKLKRVKGMFVVSNDRGLHTRPSTEIVKCATSFKCEISLSYQKNHVNAKSILGVLMLAASKGAKISIEAVGDDADLAVASIISLANQNFNISY